MTHLILIRRKRSNFLFSHPPQPVQWTAPTFAPIQSNMEFVRSSFGTLTESKVQAHPEGSRPPTSTSNRESGFIIRRYRPNICTCENPRVKKSAITGEKKCVKCNNCVVVTKADIFYVTPKKAAQAPVIHLTEIKKLKPQILLL